MVALFRRGEVGCKFFETVCQSAIHLNLFMEE